MEYIIGGLILVFICIVVFFILPVILWISGGSH